MSPWLQVLWETTLKEQTSLSEQKAHKLQTISVRQGRHLTPEIPLFKACTVFPLWNV